MSSILEPVGGDKGGGNRPNDITVFSFPAGEICAGMPPVQASMPIRTSI